MVAKELVLYLDASFDIPLHLMGNEIELGEHRDQLHEPLLQLDPLLLNE